MSVAMAIPLIGFDDEPSSPVIREETTAKKKPKTMMATAERMDTAIPGTALSWGRNAMKTASAIDPTSTIEMGMSLSVRRRCCPSPSAVSRRSRKEARKLSTIVGMAFIRLMMPPAATAPAPMYRM